MEEEIEYLEEDEDLIQQYVQSAATPVKSSVTKTKFKEIRDSKSPLLVERKPAQNKRKYKDSDDDYVVSDDEDDDETWGTRTRKKKKTPSRAVPRKQFTTSTPIPDKLRRLNDLSVVPVPKAQSQRPTCLSQPRPRTQQYIIHRKGLNIVIPDYDDAICLPARAVKRDENDKKRLNEWNDLCMQYYKKSESFLHPSKGRAVTSTRSLVIKNIKSTITGRVETSVWGKSFVQNEQGEKKSDMYQCILPRFREKRNITNYELTRNPIKRFKHRNEVILTREDHKDAEMLVAYNPKEAIAAVYKFVGKRAGEDDSDLEVLDDEDRKSFIREVTCCKICAPCYQSSWRGIRKNVKRDIVCAVCSHSFVSVYNLLSHLKTHHRSDEVRKHSKAISSALAGVVEYHYKCRICLNMFESIKELRKHVFTHQGSEIFKCEVGNHMAS